MFARLCCTVSLVAVLLMALPAAAVDYIWIEAEQPTSVPKIAPPENQPDDVGYRASAWGNKDVISGDVLSVNLAAGEAHKRLPPGGAVFGYDFEVKTPGAYEIWNRIGFEWIRSSFDWRLDNGAWKTVPSTELTCDIQLIQNWNELAWIQLGRQDIAAGKHRLEIRLVPQFKPKGDQQEPDRTIFTSDCMVLTRGTFRPNGKFKPDAKYQTDEDLAAGKHVYAIAVADEPAQRSATELGGLWEIARWDEQVVARDKRLAPADALPDLNELYWYGIRVPGDRNKLRPELAYAHRYIYRTRVEVPAAAAGRSFQLDFQNFNMIATVFVNGRRCGFSKAHSTAWLCDITPAVRPGAVNELCIVFKDAYYAIDETEKDIGTRYYWNLPHDWLHNQGVSMKFDMPVAWDTRTGILEPVSLVVSGKVYTADVFARPSVSRKSLALETTVVNPSAAAVQVRVENEIVPFTPGAAADVAKRFAAKELSVPPGEAKTLETSEPWADAKLWWPDDPKLYEVVTRLVVDGKAVDVKRTRFGFREWQWDGLYLKLNGVNWPMWADCDYGRDPHRWLEQSKRSGMRMIRYWFRDGWGGLTRRQALDFCDEHGVPVRNSGVFDGEHAAYRLVEGERDDRRPRKALFDNWNEQLAAWVKAERNHPSVFIWSIENEIVYINANNFGLGEIVEPAVRDAAERVMKLDPTRPVMVDGGRALRDMSLPINGCHYDDEQGVSQRDYPDAAYTREHWYQVKGRNAWPMAPDKPIFHGEVFFANGYTPSRFAGLGGERCFIGVAETAAARSLYAKILSEGWRWCDVAAWHFWFGENADTGYWNAWQPVACLCREWNWTFAGGSQLQRTLKVFNSTRHADPIDVEIVVNLGDRAVGGLKQQMAVPPGEAQQLTFQAMLPKVARRTAGQFIITCSRGGKEVFREVKPLSVIDPAGVGRSAVSAGQIAVVDPHGAVAKRLGQRGVPFTAVASLEQVPATARIVIIGKDAVTEAQATNPAWMLLAARGVRLLVLEQQHPLHYQAVPADFDVTDFTGRIAFVEDLSHPAFAGLEQADFFTWSRDHVVYRNAYRKPSRGARSLVQCDMELGCSALAESAINDGLMVFCQLVVGEKLDSDPIAQVLFDNLVNYLVAYKPVRKETALVVDPESEKGRLLANLGLKYDLVKDPVAALSGKHQIAVIDATPQNLKALAGALDRVNAFTAAGGWLVLWGVTPEGLADFNRVVGFEHVMRPFQMERVVLAMPRDPLTSGLTLRDVVMEDSERIASWMGVRWLADDAFTHIVDYTDIAPFAKLPPPDEMGIPAGEAKPRADHWPPNMVNGLTAEDSWRYCYSVLMDLGYKTRWTMELPRPEELTNFAIALNTIYHKVTKINLYFDDDPTPFVVETRPVSERQDFSVQGKRAKRITVELADWEKSGRQNVIGIDNLWLGVKRSPEFIENVRPLLNIGGLVRYNRGPGGIVLNQLNVVKQERLPINAEKKATIVKTILKNLGATFAGGQAVIVGSGLQFTPVVMADSQLNAYFRKGNDGWFRHPKGDLTHLPLGEQSFAGVKYAIADFKTSPVPSCVILRGKAKEEGVKAIKVGRQADALFFLHTLEASRQLHGWKPQRNQPNPPIVFQYVVHYADGKSVDVPVVWNDGVGHWLSQGPKALKNAAVGWSAPFSGDASGDQAVVYSMQWNNPRPEVAIESIDIAGPPADQRPGGDPAVLAITAAKVVK